MSLLNQYVQNYGQLGPFFERIREAQAPSKFSQQFLKDIGFTSSNYRAYIPLLKGLGFLSDDGSPKSEYMQLLDATQWRKAIARALLKSYSDIFVLKSKPTKSDKAARGPPSGKKPRTVSNDSAPSSSKTWCRNRMTAQSR